MLAPSRNSAAGNTSAVFVAHEKVLQGSRGGVQVCNREYMSSLSAAGFALHPVAYQFHRTLLTRITNRVLPRVTKVSEPRHLLQLVHEAVRNSNATHIFFGVNIFADLSRELKRQFPDVRQVLLSHGLESIDFCIEQQIRRHARTENRSRAVAERMLGQEVLAEFEQRRYVDFVLTLSPLDAELEHWLGVEQVLWLPRTIMEPPLDAQPVDQRVGCVSTLDHPPNHAGLQQLFDALDRQVDGSFRFRLVGLPATHGAELAKRYRFVDYLGTLSDEQLRAEAASWCCFVHPIFVYAKGCSTKLATGLGWGLPIAATKYGARGYVWDEKIVPLARSPEELVSLVLERCRAAHFADHRKATKDIVGITPSLAAIGGQIRKFLGLTSTHGVNVGH